MDFASVIYGVLKSNVMSIELDTFAFEDGLLNESQAYIQGSK